MHSRHRIQPKSKEMAGVVVTDGGSRGEGVGQPLALEDICLDRVVQSGVLDNGGAEDTVLRLLYNLPTTTVYKLLSMVCKKSRDGQLNIQRAIEGVFNTEAMSDINVCCMCGNQEVVDMSRVQENIVSGILSKSRWVMCGDTASSFLQTIEFGAAYECRYRTVKAKYNRHFGMTSIAHPFDVFALEKLVAEHGCTIRGCVVVGMRFAGHGTMG